MAEPVDELVVTAGGPEDASSTASRANRRLNGVSFTAWIRPRIDGDMPSGMARCRRANTATVTAIGALALSHGLLQVPVHSLQDGLVLQTIAGQLGGDHP